jgi:uncharacterized protein YggE
MRFVRRLLAAAVTLVLLHASAFGEEQPPPQIVVIGTATIKASPDQAFVTLAVESRDASPQKAQRDNATAMDQVMKKLTASGLDAKAIRTLSYELTEEFDYDRGKRMLRGYLARNMIELRLDQIDRVGATIDAAVSSGTTSVSSVRFDVKERESLEREALKRAVADARARADAAAAGGGVTISRILRIEQHGATPRPPPVPLARMAMGAAEEATTTPIAAGDIEIEASVTLAAALN